MYLFSLLSTLLCSLFSSLFLSSFSFGCPVREYPRPDVNYAAFAKLVHTQLTQEQRVYNPHRGVLTPWISESRLKKAFDPDAGKCVLM